MSVAVSVALSVKNLLQFLLMILKSHELSVVLSVVLSVDEYTGDVRYNSELYNTQEAHATDKTGSTQTGKRTKYDRTPHRIKSPKSTIAAGIF